MRVLALLLLATACEFQGAALPPPGSADAPVPAADAGVGPDAPPGAADAAPLPDARPPDEPGVVVVPPQPLGMTVIVDGNLDEWEDIDFATFNASSSGHFDAYGSGYMASATVDYAFLHAPTVLYVAFRVHDTNDGEPSADPYDDDSVELYFDVDGDADGAYDEVDHFILAAMAGGCIQLAGGGNPVMQCASDPFSGIGYNIEMAITLASLNLVPLPAQIGFGMGANDDDSHNNPNPFPDDAVDGYVPSYWNEAGGCVDCCVGEPLAASHTEPWCDTSRLGVMIFSE